MLCGLPPFMGKNEDVIKKIKKGEWSFEGETWDFISSEAKDLVTKLMTLKASDRLSAKDALEHEWLKHDDDETSIAQNDINAEA